MIYMTFFSLFLVFFKSRYFENLIKMSLTASLITSPIRFPK